MKNFLSLWVFLAILTLNSYAQNSLKVLFVGNSYIYTNNLPQATADIAASCGDTLNFSSSAPGGCTFQQHLSNTTTQSLIAQGGWNFVILQEQSQLPSFPISQVENECFPYAQRLSQMIREKGNEEVAFYMTWGRKNGDASNCANYPPLCTYEGMDSLLYERYTMMAEQNSAVISPVGRVWHYLRTHHPEIELYSSDESHPSLTGTYAAAVTFYTILFRKSPLNASNLTLDATTAAAIRQAAQTVVYDSLDFWYRFVETPNPIQENHSEFCVKIYPNPTSQFLTIETTGEIAKEIAIYNELGMAVTTLLTTNLPKIQISISHLPNGYYIAEIRSEKGISHQKFVVAK